MTKKYIVKRTTLRHENGICDILESQFEYDNLEEERTRLKQEHNCKNVHFRFIATDARYIKTGDIFKLIKEKENLTEDDLCEFLDSVKTTQPQ
ncbi:MAG TPA: hypothetical protein DHV48_03760 [Prolixibacteraceae bacterium]|nr:hypothetical protein [Prolixibacteraceae bacterium]